MFPGNICDLHQDFFRINRPGRIIGVDDHNGFGPVCDLTLHIFQIRIPVRLFIADIVDRFSSCQRYAPCPERIIRRRHQDLVSVVQKGKGQDTDQLADPVSYINVIYGHIRDVL